MPRSVSLVVVVLLILLLAVTTIGRGPIAETIADNPYGTGGSGNYADYLGIMWFREWDHYHRPETPNPPQRFWTVGKLNNRLGDCLPGTLSGTRENIDGVFACDSPIITEIVGEGYMGQVWEIGNEPNWYPYVTPEDYAYQLNLYHEFITDLDPTAYVMNGGVSLYLSGWKDWLDSFVAAYINDYGTPPPVAVWNCHPYDIFDAQAGARTIAKIVSFRDWLDGAGFESAVFWITEFGKGNWQPEPEQNIVVYIKTVCGWLNEHAAEYGTERWFWWGILAGSQGMGANGLFSAGPYDRNSVTLAGDAYIEMSGRVFVDRPEYERDCTRAMGTMRNPYVGIGEAMDCTQPGTIIYDFRDGTETRVPVRIYLPLMFNFVK